MFARVLYYRFISKKAGTRAETAIVRKLCEEQEENRLDCLSFPFFKS